MRNLLCLSLAILILFSQAAVAQPVTSDQEARIQELEKVLQQQDQRIQQLQQRVADRPATSVVTEYANSPAAQETKPIAGHEVGGFFVRTPDGKLELFLSGYIQMGLAIFENDTPENNGFYPNGISLAFDMYLLENWHGRIQLNFHNAYRFSDVAGGWNGVNLRDAYVEYLSSRTDPAFNVRVGQTHVPFTIGGQYGETDGIAIWGAPFINAWSHGRDPGIMIWGRLSDMIEYKASLHNGEGANRLNGTDDFLMALGCRLYPFNYSENSNTFFHVGFIRTRDTDGDNTSGQFGSATLSPPWGRRVFGDVLAVGDAATTRGWRTGVDTGFRFDAPLDPEKTSSIRAEVEFMYMMWERKLSTGRLPFLNGYGISFGLVYKMNLTPDIEGEGLWPLFEFSYSDVDNKSTNDTGLGANIDGQRVFTYTLGVGYSFNKFVSVAFNWVVVNLDEKDAYGDVPARDDRADGSDDLEHAWFLQVTAQW